MTRTQASPARTAAARKRAAANPLDPASLVIASVPIAGDRFHAVYSPADHVIRAGGFGDPEALLDRLLGPAPEREPGSVSSGDAGSTTRVRAQADEDEVTRALRAYAAGDRAALDALRVEQPGTEFRHAVWQALRAVPAGETVSYTELAAAAGRPAAVRAAASACATNLVALIVPCHRIVRRDGALGGYLFGVPLKERLLAEEAATR